MMCCSGLICETFLKQENVVVSEKMHWLKHLMYIVLQGEECTVVILKKNNLIHEWKLAIVSLFLSNSVSLSAQQLPAPKFVPIIQKRIFLWLSVFYKYTNNYMQSE